MSENIQAIYENGVLRPLQPLDLDEHEIVSVWVEKSIDQEAAAVDAEVAHQQQAIRGFLERMERLPVRAASNGFSNRDHDQVLYPKKP
jgi:predicted DNA-binding antitoxin AbrB/MazE fold protein